MSKGTNRARRWLFAGLLLGGIVGCGVDEQTEIIAETNARLKELTGKLGEVKGLLKKAVDVSKEKNQRITATDENLLQAIETAKDVRKIGQRLQRIKEFSDRAKEKTTPEQSKELLARYRSGFQESLVELEKEEKALTEVVKLAEDNAEAGTDLNKIYGKAKVDDLKKELKNGRDAFELLTKQR